MSKFSEMFNQNNVFGVIDSIHDDDMASAVSKLRQEQKEKQAEEILSLMRRANDLDLSHQSNIKSAKLLLNTARKRLEKAKNIRDNNLYIQAFCMDPSNELSVRLAVLMAVYSPHSITISDLDEAVQFLGDNEWIANKGSYSEDNPIVDGKKLAQICSKLISEEWFKKVRGHLSSNVKKADD